MADSACKAQSAPASGRTFVNSTLSREASHQAEATASDYGCSSPGAQGLRAGSRTNNSPSSATVCSPAAGSFTNALRTWIQPSGLRRRPRDSDGAPAVLIHSPDQPGCEYRERHEPCSRVPRPSIETLQRP